jgi:phosphatidylinositol kinase/protein kinase (PI-3  family)
MNREKFPEKVPFRLTRMLIKAMEVSGIEGSYRSTCERTMTILRENRDSLVAMLEAFLYDPLISWRLEDLSNNLEHLADSSRLHLVNPVLPSEVDTRRDEPTHYVDYGVPIDVAGRSGVLPISEGDEELDDDDEGDEIADGTLQNSLRDHVPSMRTHISREVANSATSARSRQMYSNIQTFAANLHSADERIASITGGDGVNQLAASSSIARSRMSERTMRQRELSSLLGGEEGLAAEEALNEKALKVIRRVQDKLAGTDFEDRAENGEPLDVVDQVQRLIVQATSVENLSQLFIGWCAFW